MATISEKITSRETLAPLIEEWRRAGKVVGFTSGTFDLLHGGHVSYLEAARSKCDVLVVGVNTDASVRAYKNVRRPIVPEARRAQVVAALASVDYVFLFDEENNAANIEVLKPSFYIKGGDYAHERLTSASLVEQYGGAVELIPKEEGLSTTSIIETIIARYAADAVGSGEPARAAFVDRDGTINKDIEYLHEPEKFELLPHAAEGLKKFQDMGYKICIFTLQTGIGLGYFSREDFFKVNREMFRQLKPFGITIDKIYFATTAKTPDGKNSKEELIRRAMQELNIDLKNSVVIGDKTGDIASGEPFGCVKIGVKTGKNLQDGDYSVPPDYVAEHLLDAADFMASKIPNRNNL